jgi:hypothetical protein
MKINDIRYIKQKKAQLVPIFIKRFIYIYYIILYIYYIIYYILYIIYLYKQKYGFFSTKSSILNYFFILFYKLLIINLYFYHRLCFFQVER